MPNLNTKLGPLPVKTWIIVVGGLGVGLYIYRRSQASNATTATDSADATAGVSTDTPSTDSASYYSPTGGGGGFYDGSNYTPAPPATPPPAPNPAPAIIGLPRSTCLTNLHKYNTLWHSLGAQLTQLHRRHAALTQQIRSTKDARAKARIHAQDVKVQAQVRAVQAKATAALAAYTSWQARCAGVA